MGEFNTWQGVCDGIRYCPKCGKKQVFVVFYDGSAWEDWKQKPPAPTEPPVLDELYWTNFMKEADYVQGSH